MPPSMITKVTPVGENEQDRGIAREPDRGAELEKAGLRNPDQQNENRQRRERQPLSDVVRPQGLAAIARPYIR